MSKFSCIPPLCVCRQRMTMATVLFDATYLPNCLLSPYHFFIFFLVLLVQKTKSIYSWILGLAPVSNEFSFTALWNRWLFHSGLGVVMLPGNLQPNQIKDHKVSLRGQWNLVLHAVWLRRHQSSYDHITLLTTWSEMNWWLRCKADKELLLLGGSQKRKERKKKNCTAITDSEQQNYLWEYFSNKGDII